MRQSCADVKTEAEARQATEGELPFDSGAASPGSSSTDSDGPLWRGLDAEMHGWSCMRVGAGGEARDESMPLKWGDTPSFRGMQIPRSVGYHEEQSRSLMKMLAAEREKGPGGASSSSYAHDLGLVRTVSAILDHSGATSPLFTRQPGVMGSGAQFAGVKYGAPPPCTDTAALSAAYFTEEDTFTTQVIYEPPNRTVSAPNAPLQYRRRLVRCERKRPDNRPLFLIAKKLCEDRGMTIMTDSQRALVPNPAPNPAVGPAAAALDAAAWRADASSADGSAPSSPAPSPLFAVHADRDVTWAPLPPLRRGVRS